RMHNAPPRNAIDECWTWANKAEALASYARQIDDETLLDLAKRIKARAIRQAGILLEEVEPQQGARTELCTGAGTRLIQTRSSAASDAGLSKRQKDTALRIANIPRDEFEKQIESDEVPTVTELAAQGTKQKEATPQQQEHLASDRLIGFLNHIVREGKALDVERGVRV
ncbi:MAG: hypothetical protein ACREX4_22195, partial [Gammaproteobacteria bacterium]